MPAAFGLVKNKRNEILLIQRGYGSRKGKWSLPGGNMDKGESLRQTARRETLEETGIRMTVDHLYYQGQEALRGSMVWETNRRPPEGAGEGMSRRLMVLDLHAAA